MPLTLGFADIDEALHVCSNMGCRMLTWKAVKCHTFLKDSGLKSRMLLLEKCIVFVPTSWGLVSRGISGELKQCTII
jgi:hypothetical protein